MMMMPVALTSSPPRPLPSHGGVYELEGLSPCRLARSWQHQKESCKSSTIAIFRFVGNVACVLLLRWPGPVPDAGKIDEAGSGHESGPRVDGEVRSSFLWGLSDCGVGEATFSRGRRDLLARALLLPPPCGQL